MAEATTSKTFSQAKEKASIALLDVITHTIAELRESDWSLTGASGAVKDLAFAYRLVSGGPQPGSVEVSSK